uniref:Trem-like transcript 4 protein isoform X4 n=1 Tax=Phascolarctos cinereus TaxID=38626 RepID=A0A6P5LAR8_PHACI|nr:trem-like transcript 4 protein isoform X4 [Phascolarctos cinereus]
MQGLGKQCGRHEEDGNFTFTTSPSYSLDPDGKAHSWLWTLTSGPQGAQVPGGVFRGGCDLLEPHGARDLSLVAATSLAAVLFLRGSESGSGESGPTPSCHPSGQGQHEETTSHVPCLWTHRVMMAQAAPLLLLLPLLLMGSQGQVLRKKYQEGQTLRVSCDYNPQRDEKRWKTWCKVREDGKACDRLITRTSALTWQRWDSRISLEDDTYSGNFSITLSKLRVNDSGIYWCGIYDPVSDTTVVLRTISLEVSPDQKGSPPKYSQTTAEMHTTNLVTPVTISRKSHFSIFSGSEVIQVLYGLIVTKGLIFTALVVLLGRCSSGQVFCWAGRSHSKLSEDQKDRK